MTPWMGEPAAAAADAAGAAEVAEVATGRSDPLHQTRRLIGQDADPANRGRREAPQRPLAAGAARPAGLPLQG